MKTGSYLPLHSIFPFEFFLAWNLHLKHIMMKQKLIAKHKNKDASLTTLALKFKEAGYKLTAHRDSKKKEEKNNSPFNITPINPDNVWCFNVCKPETG
jgi:hypothetical protein